MLAAYLAIRAVLMTGWYGIGWDAHAYFVSWSGGLYEELPRSIDAYNYSPLFAQVVWPLTLLPWPVFCAVFIGAAGLGIAWLVRPLPRLLGVGVWLACLPEILSGNIFWLLALMAVLGLTRGSPWCVAAFTKVLPCLGPVWFLARGEWRRLAGFVTVAAVLLAVSVAVSPGEWSAWIDFLRDSAGDASGKVYLAPWSSPSRWSSASRWVWRSSSSPPARTGRGSCRSRWCSPARSWAGGRSPCSRPSRACSGTATGPCCRGSRPREGRP